MKSWRGMNKHVAVVVVVVAVVSAVVVVAVVVDLVEVGTEVEALVLKVEDPTVQDFEESENLLLFPVLSLLPHLFLFLLLFLSPLLLLLLLL